MIKVKLPKLTVTDVLRVAVYMSGGDISLPAVPPAKIKTNRWSSYKSNNPYRAAFKFKNFKRSERRIILGLLEKTNCDVTEAVLKEGRWIRLGEKLHPGEFSSKFPKSFAMFNKIRNEKVQSWYGKVNKAFEESFEAGARVLAQRPGEFVRRMDWMLRPNKEVTKKTKPGSFSALEKYATKEPHVALSVTERKEIVLTIFKEIAKKVSNKVLYEVYRHFEGRYIATENRGIMIKGARKRTPLPELPSIAPDVIESVQRVVVNTLIEKFSELPKLGKVSIDENLKKIPLPTNMRSVSTSLRPTMRGQRVPIGNTGAKVIRAFVHWFDENGSIDIDLSATLLGDGNGKTANFSWNASHKESFGCHSGDVICRPGACAEYIDVNVDKALEAGLRYVIVLVHNYRGSSLLSVKDCVAGAMEREFAESNLNFVPATLSNCMRLESPASTSIMCVIDLKTREYIHLDVDINGIPVLTNQSKKLFDAIAPYMELPKFSVYDLVELHATARAEEIVDGVDTKADVYFTFEEFTESYIKTLEYMGI